MADDVAGRDRVAGDDVGGEIDEGGDLRFRERPGAERARRGAVAPPRRLSRPSV
jgi:hypothetical protein